jgi:hypothetical protein
MTLRRIQMNIDEHTKMHINDRCGTLFLWLMNANCIGNNRSLAIEHNNRVDGKNIANAAPDRPDTAPTVSIYLKWIDQIKL